MCLYLGVLHPDHLLQQLTSRQWAGWLAYLTHFPLPHDRADINTALSRATAMACAGSKSADPSKLIPTYGKLSQRLTGRQIKEKTDAWIASSRKS